jgi:aryl-alcohol dehydrogenase-like predicted oxidoreductase
VQNPYSLVNRSVDNAWTRPCTAASVGLLAYSPLGFGVLTGKYDTGIDPGKPGVGRLSRFASMRQQRWAGPRLWRWRANTTRWPASTA